MKKCINETFAVCTPTTRIMINVFDDGSTEKQYEQYLIEDKVIRMINHGNRDKQGNRYTTDKVIHLSDIGWKNWNDEYLNYMEKQNG